MHSLTYQRFCRDIHDRKSPSAMTLMATNFWAVYGASLSNSQPAYITQHVISNNLLYLTSHDKLKAMMCHCLQCMEHAHACDLQVSNLLQHLSVSPVVPLHPRLFLACLAKQVSVYNSMHGQAHHYNGCCCQSILLSHYLSPVKLAPGCMVTASTLLAMLHAHATNK